MAPSGISGSLVHSDEEIRFRFYTVEAILNHREVRKTRQFLVYVLGRISTDNSWVKGNDTSPRLRDNALNFTRIIAIFRNDDNQF